MSIVYTPYSLYLYLLYSNEEELNHTFFFFGEGIHKGIRDKFDNMYFFSDELYRRRNICSKLLYRIRLRNKSRKIWPFLADAHILAQDIFFFSAALIGKRNYTMIEDAPNVIHRWRNLLNKPIVAFDAPCGPKDIIIDGQNGFLVRTGDIATMADRINTLIESEELRKSMGTIAHQMSLNYSEENVMMKWLDLFYHSVHL